jgi:F-type H+-transporting ATPase subunit delta
MLLPEVLTIGIRRHETDGSLTLAANSVPRPSEAAQRYANALFGLAQDKGALASIHKEFRAFAGLAKESGDLRKLLASPGFSRELKVSALGAIAAKAGYSELLSKFLGAMASNGRAAEILASEVAFDQLYAKQRGVQRVRVRTAKELSKAQRDRVAELISKIGGGETELSEEVDPDLIGGLQLQIGSRLIDASLATKLNRLNAAMKGA